MLQTINQMKILQNNHINDLQIPSKLIILSSFKGHELKNDNRQDNVLLTHLLKVRNLSIPYHLVRKLEVHELTDDIKQDSMLYTYLLAL